MTDSNKNLSPAKVSKTVAHPAHTAAATQFLSSRELYKAIFDADNPEQFVRSLSPQSLYTLIRERGLGSCADLLEIVPIAAMRAFLDFDLWRKDTFEEDNIWEWLSLTDEEDPLKFTQKFLKSVDLKIVSMLILKYVQSITYENQNDSPPSDGWYTPDRGYTWICVTIEDSHKHFLFTRLLALIFETSAELFYQLLAIPSVATTSSLEEEGFLDKGKRLAADGIPETDYAIELNSVLFPYQAKEILQSEESARIVSDVIPCGPLVAANHGRLQPLDEVLSHIPDIEELLGELTLIMNGSMVFFGIPFHEDDSVKFHLEKVRGAINIGIEKAITIVAVSADEACRRLGLLKLYRLGLFELFALSKAAQKIKVDEIKALESEPALFSIIAHCREEIPVAPQFLVANQTKYESDPLKPESLAPGSRAITHLDEVTTLRQIMEKYV